MMVKDVLLYIKCIKHLRALMIKDGKRDKFKQLVSRYDIDGCNFHQRIVTIFYGICPLFDCPFVEEIVNFLVEMECQLDYSNWNLMTIMPGHLLRNSSRQLGQPKMGASQLRAKNYGASKT
jgi:hypothetical protein